MNPKPLKYAIFTTLLIVLLAITELFMNGQMPLLSAYLLIGSLSSTNDLFIVRNDPELSESTLILPGYLASTLLWFPMLVFSFIMQLCWAVQNHSESET